MTRAFRRSEWWSWLREELRDRGLNPSQVVLVDGFDDDDRIEVGLLWTHDRRFIAWRREYDDDLVTVRILGWNDVTDSWPGTPWDEAASEYVQALEHTRSP